MYTKAEDFREILWSPQKTLIHIRNTTWVLFRVVDPLYGQIQIQGSVPRTREDTLNVIE